MRPIPAELMLVLVSKNNKSTEKQCFKVPRTGLEPARTCVH